MRLGKPRPVAHRVGGIPGQNGAIAPGTLVTQAKTRNAAVLVLSRRVNEQIRLGESIVVTVVRVHGDRVRLGIEAPRDVVVLRTELATRKPCAAGSAQPAARPQPDVAPGAYC